MNDQQLILLVLLHQQLWFCALQERIEAIEERLNEAIVEDDDDDDLMQARAA